MSLTYDDKESFVDAYTENVSDGGLFIRTENPLEPGEEFRLKLSLPGLPDPLIIKCEVVWVMSESKETDAADGMGVKFVEVMPKDKKTLKEYINH